jgi:hypothetical protein
VLPADERSVDGELIADAGEGLDADAAAGQDFAQVGDVDVDGARLPVEVNSIYLCLMLGSPW